MMTLSEQHSLPFEILAYSPLIGGNGDICTLNKHKGRVMALVVIFRVIFGGKRSTILQYNIMVFLRNLSFGEI